MMFEAVLVDVIHGSPACAQCLENVLTEMFSISPTSSSTICHHHEDPQNTAGGPSTCYHQDHQNTPSGPSISTICHHQDHQNTAGGPSISTRHHQDQPNKQQQQQQQQQQNPSRPRVFIMCRSSSPWSLKTTLRSVPSPWSLKTTLGSVLLLDEDQVCVLEGDTISERLYSFKKTLDLLNLSSVAVLTSETGQKTLSLYQQQLFTAVYSFHYVLMSPWTTRDPQGCGGCTTTADAACGSDSIRRSVQDVCQEVSMFLQSLPAVDGRPVSILKSSLLPDMFLHGFSLRSGGVSYLPTLSSLNLFSSPRRRDPPALVAENARRLALEAGFYPATLTMAKVEHGSTVWLLGKEAEPERYDAIVTDRRGVVLAAPGADCMTVLFCDPEAKVIGVAHAGYRGTLAGVCVSTLDAMVRGFGSQARDVRVAVGPSVGPCCFTLDRQQAAAFHHIHPSCLLGRPDSPRPHVNLRLANRLLLQRAGVLDHHIHDDQTGDHPRVTLCTCCHPGPSFYSHVRDGSVFGTQVGFLWIPQNTPEGDAGSVPE